MESFLLLVGFSRCHSDSNVYILRQEDALLFLALYVDDLIVTGSTSSIIASIKITLHDMFSMTELGLLHYFLRIEITWSSSRISLAQPKYALDLLAHFHMVDCKLALTPFLSRVKLEAKCSTPLVDATLYHQLVGRLIYLTHTHPDISFVVGIVSHFMMEPHELHWKAVKHIFHYIQGTHRYEIHYAMGTSSYLIGYMDSDWAGDLDDHKSTSCYNFHLGFSPICWQLKKQHAIYSFFD
jgi:hypothetical protein